MKNWIMEFFKGETKQVEISPTHAFCENIAAGSLSRWHIRLLSEKGKKLSGGADTLALCGCKVHWDRNYPVNKAAVILLKDTDVCRTCAALYEDEVAMHL